ncbi:alpha/beta fold hydrolase (plasmid) [Rhizobium ruizarguesonis]|uniref:AB hydrolase-1 domain-containing protein n=1 Tax=Rhizobium leguminosarum TaxID=384 RepID=A0A2K9ZCF7_RHILE|nr:MULTISPECIES: alpha/beta fold hydrolase [Rhizobium]AUW45880.1 hypothetical protein CUJ84_pRLN1000415 [Rhizobium leguminosarum]TBA94351.1 alpha/beta fold hydrolase [Rhizobium ruizarguesonis]
MADDNLLEFSDGTNKLYGRYHYPNSVRDCPLVVLLTGDGPNGSKSSTWPNLTKKLNDRGLATFLFDFSGLGNSPGVYRELTLSTGCLNFRGVMEFLKAGDHDHNRVGAIGSSYGGNVILLEGADYPAVKAIGLKSASAFLPEGYVAQYGAAEVDKWAREGFSEEIGLNYSAVLDSLMHNTFERASKIQAPVRFVHGTADSAVPIRHARDLVKLMPNATIHEIDGADHWYAEGDEWEQMADNLADFMKEKL